MERTLERSGERVGPETCCPEKCCPDKGCPEMCCQEGSGQQRDGQGARDDIARTNEAWWSMQPDTVVSAWLELDHGEVERYAQGAVFPDCHILHQVYPQHLLRDVAGKRVLCLASGGGQQSAVFGMLGAEVTVLDLTERQLERDRAAAARYGYDVRTVRGDMRDLSMFAPESFDLVFQAASIFFVPQVREVYAQVNRVLSHNGVYRVGHINPATQVVDPSSWDGSGYRIRHPYASGRVDESGPTMEYRHLLSDIFNGLIEAGFMIRGVCEAPCHLGGDRNAQPGSEAHMHGYVQRYFCVVCARVSFADAMQG